MPVTTFRNKGYDARIEALHADIGPLRGAIGVQARKVDFSALGPEAFVPPTHTDSKAVFVFEELPLGKRVKLSFGGRHERTEVRSEGGGPTDAATGAPRFGPPHARSFSGNSGALGMLYGFTPNLAFAANGSYTERAPTFYELYANGPHAASGTYEIGDPGFGNEQTRSINLALRMKAGAHAGSLSAFASRFSNYITLFPTGNTRGADGEVNPLDADGDDVADVSGEEILPEFAYRAVAARFRGLEAEGRFRVAEGPCLLDLILRFDYVRAENRSTGLPLPRIPPRRYSAGLAYRQQQLRARLDMTYVDDQHRVSPNERPTDAYTMVNAALTYFVKLGGQASAQLFLRGVNLLNEEARNHVSLLKGIAPLGRRSAQLGVRAQF